jgi:hypothetical protein
MMGKGFSGAGFMGFSQRSGNGGDVNAEALRSGAHGQGPGCYQRSQFFEVPIQPRRPSGFPSLDAVSGKTHLDALANQAALEGCYAPENIPNEVTKLALCG